MQYWLKQIKIVFLSTVVLLQLLTFVNPVVVQAADLANPIDTTTPAQGPAELPVYNAGVDKSIQDYLCTPSGTGTDLFDCIGRLYRFGISAGAIAIVFFLVYAGYIYITGGEASKTKAKQTLYSALTGIAIMLGSYVLLNFINPNLVQIKTIQPPIFKALNLPSCEDIGFVDKCIITTGGSSGQVYSPPGATGKGGCFNKEQGACNKQTLAACPGMAKNVELGLRICNQESGGGQYGIMSGTDRCKEETTGQVVSFSGGLWQINIENSASDFPECAGVLKHVSPGDHCSVHPPYKTIECTCRFGSGGRSAYDKCVAALKDPVKNTQQACHLFNTKSKGGTEPGIRGWQPWVTSYNKCKNSTQ